MMTRRRISQGVERSPGVRYRGAVAMVAAGLCAAAACGQDAEMGSNEDFPIYWVGTTKLSVLREFGDLAAQMDFGHAKVDRDGAIMMYAGFSGLYPLSGLHILLMNEGISGHRQKLRDDIEQRVPEGYTGIVLFDYEEWKVQWDRLPNTPSDAPLDAEDYDFKDDWREYQLLLDPNVFDGMSDVEIERHLKRSYNQAARNYFTVTVNTLREMRPDAQVAFFDYPPKRYQHPIELPRGVIGYDTHTHLASELNNDVDWFWDLIDVTVPCLYAVRYTVPDGEPWSREEGTNAASDNWEFLHSNVRESLRLRPDKPCVPIVWTRYLHNDPQGQQRWHWQMMNPLNTEQAFLAVQAAGASGVMLWEGINYRAIYEETQQWVYDVLEPILIEHYGDRTCAGDFTHDGEVDGEDFLRFLEAFFREDLLADLNGDGIVDGADFLGFLEAFYEDC